MPDSDNPLSELDIDVCNVRPAFEASLAAGVPESEIVARLGWSRELLSDDDATVSGRSTHEHMAWMASRPGYAAFVLDAVRRHSAESLGIVGLACKTAPTIADALALHGRYQALTNRTARYDAHLEGETIRLEETRFGPASAGSLLISDYTVLVAVQLIRTMLDEEVPMLSIASRRASIPEDELQAWQSFCGAPVVVDQAKAALVCPAEFLARPLPTRDAELAAFFQRTLRRSHPEPAAQTWLERARHAIEQRLASGTPTAASVSRELGLGARTLGRRLAEHGVTFGELLAEVRRAKVTQYLADPSLSHAEIAFLLGYRERASFHRAFRRWFGTTPAAYRDSLP